VVLHDDLVADIGFAIPTDLSSLADHVADSESGW
jgi:hypothetical protein